MPQDASRTLVGVDLGGSGFRVRRLRLLSRAPLALETDDEGEETERRWPGEVYNEVYPPERPEDLGQERCALVAAEIAARAPGASLVAVAAPGRKTSDGRGIERAFHFPPVRDLAGTLAHHLAQRGLRELEVAVPIVGDGVAAARGEQAAPTGALRGVERGLYLGGGSGVSEALVLDGEVFALNELEPPLERIAEMYPYDDCEQDSGECAFTPGGVVFEWWRSPSGHAAPLSRKSWDGFRAALVAREADAVRVLAEWIGRLDPVLESRRSWLRRARPDREPALQRIVLGQAYARLFSGPAGLALLEHMGPECCISPLRAAPAIGAVAYALGHEALHGRDAWVRS